ncbi:hypothetical protein CEP52_008707 [Fusarium oligoseptatum]|uniref:Mid2 domain-containing protein n=1 Tax=Fusarium oligoseptatum TaxID=2604345 RepID=A0A428TGL3_9HYPO|nr:hypothetical protein CEP52_008707 [Fusarium oligoseptatum]
MHSLMFTALSVLGLVASVHSETVFTNPATWNAEDDDRSNYQVYEVGDRIPIRWTTDRDRISVAVWESGVSGPFLWAWVDQNLTERSTTWRVDFGNGRFDTDVGAEHARFWFALYDPEDIVDRSADGSESLVNSASFNVTIPDYKPTTAKTTTTTEAATTSSTPIETETETKSETTTSTTSTTTTSSETESAESDAADKEEDKDSGLSAGAAAGIGVGASVGGIAILGAIGFFVWRNLRKRKEQQYQGPPQYYQQQYHPQTPYQPGQTPLQSPEAKAELPAHSATTSTSQVHEAP